jgi:uncharacterized protein YhfF
MKKILRLVTTSVLTLTLVACGEASSSVSTGTTTSSSVSSVSSAFANVSTITLSAATDVLTQTMGTQKAVVVQAALNANTNPSLALEWLVNGTKSNQTGRVFEYTPAAAGTFVIEAKVGTVVSNKITVTVGAQALVITDLKVVDNNTLEVTAPGGAVVTLTGNELLPASYYDIAKGVYVLELKTALAQGGSTTVTLTRDGLAPVSRIALFDTRKLEVSAVTPSVGTALKAETDGSYKITKPHSIANGAGGANTESVVYTVALTSTNMGQTAPTAYSFTNTKVPAGATALAANSGTLVVTGNTAAASGSFQFTVNKDTLPGTYEYKYVFGVKEQTITFVVAAPVAAINFTKVTTGVEKADGSGALTGTYGFDVVYTHTWAGNSTFTGKTFGIAPNADGSYTVEKDFLNKAANDSNITKEVKFNFAGSFFDVPTNLVTATTTNPNVLVVSLVAPDGSPLMRVQPGLAQTSYIVSKQFRADFTLSSPLSTLVDATTPVGDYTYSFKVLQLGVEIYNKNLVIRVTNPAPKIDVTATVLDYSVYQTAYTAANTTLDTSISLFDATVPATRTGLVAEDDTAVALIYNNKIQTLVAPIIARSYSEAVHNANLAAWRSTFVTANPFPARGANLAAWQANLVTFVSGFVPTSAEVVTAAATGSTAYVPGTDNVNYNAMSLAFVKEVFAVPAVNIATATITALNNAAQPSETDYNAAKADYEANITFHIPLQTPATTELKVGADGFFEISRPRANTLDTSTVAFDIKVTNLQSPANPLAANSNSYLRLATAGANTKSELLTFVKSGTGAGTIPNNAAVNTANTKVALELASANTATTVNVIDTSVTTDFTYIPGSLNSVTLNDVFTQEVSFLSVAGNYNYNFAIGSLSEAIKVRVIDPTVKVDFAILQTGTPDFVKGTDGIYYATEKKTDAGALVEQSATLTLEILNFAGSATTPYTFNVKYPDFAETQTNVGTSSDKTGNDGHATFEPLLEAVATRIDALMPTTVGVGANKILGFTKKGTYEVSITVDGVTEKITLVVREFPSVKVLSANIEDVDAPLFDGAYVYKGVAGAATALFSVEAVALPAATFYTVVTTYSDAQVAADGAEALVFTSGKATIEYDFTAIAATTSAVNTNLFLQLYTKNTDNTFKFIGFTKVVITNLKTA